MSNQPTRLPQTLAPGAHAGYAGRRACGPGGSGPRLAFGSTAAGAVTRHAGNLRRRGCSGGWRGRGDGALAALDSVLGRRRAGVVGRSGRGAAVPVVALAFVAARSLRWPLSCVDRSV